MDITAHDDPAMQAELLPWLRKRIARTETLACKEVG